MKSQVVISIGQTLELDINPVAITNQSIQALTAQAGYSYINPDILKATGLIHNPGNRHMAVWSPGQDISSETADKSIKSMTTIIEGKACKGRPATIEELSSYEILFHEQLGTTNLVALGEKLLLGLYEFAAFRNFLISHRRLSLSLLTAGWISDYNFLVVFEEDLVSE